MTDHQIDPDNLANDLRRRMADRQTDVHNLELNMRNLEIEVCNLRIKSHQDDRHIALLKSYNDMLMMELNEVVQLLKLKVIPSSLFLKHLTATSQGLPILTDDKGD